MFSSRRKERKIANLEDMIKNRDKLIADQRKKIADQEATIKVLRTSKNALCDIVNSMQEDYVSIREQSFENTKKRTSRKSN